jgi:hypothetical protein
MRNCLSKLLELKHENDIKMVEKYGAPTFFRPF